MDLPSVFNVSDRVDGYPPHPLLMKIVLEVSTALRVYPED